MKRLGMTKKLCLAFIALSLLVAGLYDGYQALTSDSVTVEGKAKTARIVANGDILLHDVLYASALKEDGTYDFEPYFTYVKDRISSADLAIGDYEGTISPDHPLSGYPLFNAPPSIATALKNTGYDVMDLAHNHILDSGLEGALNTKKTFNDLGIDTIGLYDKDRSKDGFLIKDVNGIKIAILGYSYGYNGMEANLTEEEYDKHLSDLDETKIKAEL
ncbi:CapA family protein, partial [Streptococcus pluranimalium]